MIPLVLLALITAPVGWQGGANRELVEQTGKVGHFGGVHGVIEAERYDAPAPGVVLYVTRVAATTDDLGSAAEAEVGVLGHPITSRTLDNKAIVATAAWRDGDVSGTARLLIAATKDRIVAVKGECYVGPGAQPASIAACAEALATLDPGIAGPDRVPIPAPSNVPAVPHLSTPGLTEQHVTMPPMTVKQETPGPDRRPVYAGAGLIVIAAIFWWNRRRRASL